MLLYWELNLRATWNKKTKTFYCLHLPRFYWSFMWEFVFVRCCENVWKICMEVVVKKVHKQWLFIVYKFFNNKLYIHFVDTKSNSNYSHSNSNSGINDCNHWCKFSDFCSSCLDGTKWKNLFDCDTSCVSFALLE